MSDAGLPLVALLGVDSVREKTLYQSRWLAEHGYRVHIFTNHRDAGSITHDPSATIVAVEPSALGRTRQVWAYLRAHRRELHHVELYSGGRFGVVYALLCRLLGVKIIVVERGDLLYCRRRIYPLANRLAIYACYRLAHRIWYREPYMAAHLRRWRLPHLFFLPNAVPVPERVPAGERPVDFLWVNRVIPERNPLWFVHALLALGAAGPVSAEILGFGARRATSDVHDLEERVRKELADLPSVRGLDFTDPRDHYARARFFVLPADVVFGNFGLFEAMSYGVVPIVSNVEGTELLIEDGHNGFLVDHDPDALLSAMRRALTLDDAAWRTLSAAARRSVEERHSLDAWGEELVRQYALLKPVRGVRSERRE